MKKNTNREDGWTEEIKCGEFCFVLVYNPFKLRIVNGNDFELVRTETKPYIASLRPENDFWKLLEEKLGIPFEGHTLRESFETEKEAREFIQKIDVIKWYKEHNENTHPRQIHYTEGYKCCACGCDKGKWTKTQIKKSGKDTFITRQRICKKCGYGGWKKTENEK